MKRRVITLLKANKFNGNQKDGYANDLYCFLIDEHKPGETIVIDSEGYTVGTLPTDVYAVAGWLVVKGFNVKYINSTLYRINQ